MPMQHKKLNIVVLWVSASGDVRTTQYLNILRIYLIPVCVIPGIASMLKLSKLASV
jgi:hypothetical protein